MLDIERYPEETRRALVLASIYADYRRGYQKGYRLHKLENAEGFLETPIFKQFLTVTKWLMDNSWSPGMDAVHWKGYLKYVFQEMQPKIPQPGQLKNKVHLANYIGSAPQHTEKTLRKMSPDKLAQLYEKHIVKNIPLREKLLKQFELEDRADSMEK